MVPRKGQSLDAYAHSEAQKLLVEIAPYAGHWNYGAWGKISEAICREGENVREGSPSGLVVYEHFLRIALIYLNKFRSDEIVRELVANIKSDVSRFAYHIKSMNMEKHFTKLEVAHVHRALMSIEILIETFERSLKGHA